MKRSKLPTGIQTFRTIREQDCYYVDKTEHIQRLIAAGTHYFLSRPRRFGKSLLVDTLKELFEANEPLFRGLAIHDNWDWQTRYPVVRFSFAAGDFSAPGALAADCADQMAAMERRIGAAPQSATPHRRLADLVNALHAQTRQPVVVLVDEYDRPITAAFGEPAIAAGNRDFLRGLYGVVKDCDALIRFSFFTGVSKFSKVSIFSDLNNLTDITLDKRFATICGYTDNDLDTVFAPELEGLDRQRMRDWYDGYSWRGEDTVYNPYGMLLFLQSREFKPYWFETGTPGVSAANADRAQGRSGRARQAGGGRCRSGRHRHPPSEDRSAAVPDRLSDHPRRRTGHCGQPLPYCCSLRSPEVGEMR